jgi:hypothetical protein
MSGRSHRSLRLGALALLAALAIWPRSRATSRTAELGGDEKAHATTQAVAAGGARWQTSSAKLVSRPRAAKLTVAAVDESILTN